MYIPRKFDLLKEPSGFTKTAYENGKYELNWQPPKDLIHKSEITNYTLFWCNHKKDRPYQCDVSYKRLKESHYSLQTRFFFREC